MRKLAAFVIVAVIALGGSALFTRTSAQVGLTNRCSSLPKACHYTLQDGCCVADPRFDCFDVCF
jgi:hypothetical protein